MHSNHHSGQAGSQSPRPTTLATVPAQPSSTASARKIPTGHRPALLTAAQAACEVFGVSERTFHAMRAKGLVPHPIQLGPRLLRWARSDLEAAVAALPRQEPGPAEPAQLARGRIERLKAAASTGVMTS